MARVYPLGGAGPQAHQPAPHQVLDVAHRQRQAGSVSVADAGQLPLADVGDLLDALLQGGHHDHRVIAGSTRPETAGSAGPR